MNGRAFLIGAGMGALMLWMLHDRIMSSAFTGWREAAVFIGAHVVVVFVLLSLGLVFPRLRRRLAGQRPDARHLAGMGAGMAVSVLIIHAVAHGGIL